MLTRHLVCWVILSSVATPTPSYAALLQRLDANNRETTYELYLSRRCSTLFKLLATRNEMNLASDDQLREHSKISDFFKTRAIEFEAQYSIGSWLTDFATSWLSTDLEATYKEIMKEAYFTSGNQFTPALDDDISSCETVYKKLVSPEVTKPEATPEIVIAPTPKNDIQIITPAKPKYTQPKNNYPSLNMYTRLVYKPINEYAELPDKDLAAFTANRCYGLWASFPQWKDNDRWDLYKVSVQAVKLFDAGLINISTAQRFKSEYELPKNHDLRTLRAADFETCDTFYRAHFGE